MSEETARVENSGDAGQRGESTAVAPPPPSPELTGLSPRKQLALQALMAGKNLTRAAYAAGVTRQTLHKWRREEPRFAAALQRWQTNAFATAQTLLLEGIEDAAQAICEAVSSGDAYVAMELLRKLNVLGASPDGSAEAKSVPAVA
jgi:hypothetical protein